MKSALQIVGFVQSGHVEEPKDVAQRIVSGVSTRGVTISPELMTYFNACLESGIVGSANLETLVMQLFSLVGDIVPTGSLKIAIPEAILCCKTSGRTILHMSAALGYHILLDYVIRSGVDLNTRDANGHTALHFAALYGCTQCIQVLVAGGADMEIVVARGHGATQIAFQNGHTTVGKLLTVYDDVSEAEEAEADYEDDNDNAVSEGEPHDVEGDEQTSGTNNDVAMAVNETPKAPPSSPSIGHVATSLTFILCVSSILSAVALI
jgi:hypothetical protein